MDPCFELLRRRRLANLTQSQLAERAGVNISTVVRLERGQHRSSPEGATLRNIAEALGSTAAQVFPELLGAKDPAA